MKIGYIGLGKMGFNMVERMLDKGHTVVANNRSPQSIDRAVSVGAIGAYSISELVSKLEFPRTIWLMVPWQSVDSVLVELVPLLEKGDTIIDGGNSPYLESVRRAKELKEKQIDFLDIGVSGGPNGSRNGACLMIGGDKNVFEKYQELFTDLSACKITPDGEKQFAYAHFGDAGAGHFVKMVHNGIEYGMMQSIAEGFEVLKKSQFNLNLQQVAEIYNNQSVIESRLVGWLVDAYKKHSQNLDGISGSVSHSGEGQWTVEAAKILGVPTEIIEKSLEFRKNSTNNPSYTGQVVSALRGEFGGHDVANK